MQQMYIAFQIAQNGARALGVPEKFGSFSMGMRPGVLWLENMGRDGQLHHASVQRLY